MKRRNFALSIAAATLSVSTLFTLSSTNFFTPPSPEDSVAQSDNDNKSSFTHEALASGSTDDVGVRLVCVFDTSGSIDNVEFEIQLESMAKAIKSEDFQNAIFYRGGPQSVAICFVDFDHSAELRIPWVDLRKGDTAKFKQLAQEIRNMERRSSGSTDHTPALNLAATCLNNCPWASDKTIVDVLTDGKSWGASGLDIIVDKLAKEHDATINALITLVSDEPDLEQWSRENLITPPIYKRKDGSALDAGFVKAVATQRDSNNFGATTKFEKAMEMAFRRKLILEVAGISLDELKKSTETPAGPAPN